MPKVKVVQAFAVLQGAPQMVAGMTGSVVSAAGMRLVARQAAEVLLHD